MKKIFAAIVLGLVVATTGLAGAQQAEAAKTYDALLSVMEHDFVGVAKAMPADKYSFTPASLNVTGAKFTGVRTFAEEVTHVIQANYFFYAEVGGMKPDVDMKALGAMKDKDAIVTALEKSFDFAHKAMATLTAANLLDKVKPIDGMTSRGALASFGVAHGYDHYGQMVEYLRMNGVLPPGSK